MRVQNKSAFRRRARRRRCVPFIEHEDWDMIDHVGFPLSDYARAKTFYEKALAPLGYTVIMEVQENQFGAKAAGFGANGKPDLLIGGGGGGRNDVAIRFGRDT